MPRHIRDLNVESARDLNSIRLPDGQTIKKMTRKWPTTRTCLEFTCFILLFRSGYHMAFVDDGIKEEFFDLLRIVDLVVFFS